MDVLPAGISVYQITSVVLLEDGAETLELGIQIVLRPCVGAGNPNWILGKSGRAVSALTCLANSPVHYVNIFIMNMNNS